MSTDSDVEEHIISVDELSNWKVAELKEWLEKRNLKKSGLKEVLVKRVYRAMTMMDSDFSEDE